MGAGCARVESRVAGGKAAGRMAGADGVGLPPLPSAAQLADQRVGRSGSEKIARGGRSLVAALWGRTPSESAIPN